MAFAAHPRSDTLAQRLVPQHGILANQAVRVTLLLVAGCLFTALLAQIRIYLPFTPVPIVGSTLGALLAGSLLGTRLGLASMLLYLAVGALGMPVFAAGNSGIAYMQGATLGYLIAYPLVAATMGWFAEHGWDRKVGTNVLALVIGSLLFYVLGVPWLILGLGMSPIAAIAGGVLPFLIGDAIKILVAVGVLPGGWRLLGTDKQRS
ncbi:MAG: biotin transporter BioY [Chloroflexaceae bacterium]